jgi:hypothetical protein
MHVNFSLWVLRNNMLQKTLVLLPRLLLLAYTSVLAAQPDYTVSYGNDDPKRQQLNIYQSRGEGEKPIYIWAHFNIPGATANGTAGIDKAHKGRMTAGMVDDLLANGISVISWGSYSYITTIAEFQVALNDAKVMFAWVKQNATKYNWDRRKIIIGGCSRGSGISWPLGNSGDSGIIGVHFQQAFPDGFWMYPDRWDPLSFVSSNSPPICMTYIKSPRAATQTGDNHHPRHGLKIADAYKKQGIGDKAKVEYGLGVERLTYNVTDFCKSVIKAAGE